MYNCRLLSMDSCEFGCSGLVCVMCYCYCYLLTVRKSLLAVCQTLYAVIIVIRYLEATWRV